MATKSTELTPEEIAENAYWDEQARYHEEMLEEMKYYQPSMVIISDNGKDYFEI